jgi:hypothetical protein
MLLISGFQPYAQHPSLISYNFLSLRGGLAMISAYIMMVVAAFSIAVGIYTYVAVEKAKQIKQQV